MKKAFLTLVITIFSLGLFAQEQGFSTINFVAFGAKIYVNNQFIGGTNNKEILQYKMYSEGRMTITVLFGLNNRNSLTIEFKHGNNYYYEYIRGDLVSEEKAKKWMEKYPIIKAEEDLTNPFVVAKKTNSGPKQGTCFLINKQGYMLTNYHVVSEAKTIQIKGIGNDFSTAYGAEVVAFDADNDLALLKLKSQNVQFEAVPYKISLEASPQGTKSFVLGYPLTSAMGEEIKVTEGIINAKSGYKGTISQYQFSAAIQPGNSGSPLFNDNGDVIGIINAKLQGAEGAGYAIKSPYISTFLKLIDNITMDNNSTSISNLSLTEKVAKLKTYIYIVKTE